MNSRGWHVPSSWSRARINIHTAIIQSTVCFKPPVSLDTSELQHVSPFQSEKLIFYLCPGLNLNNPCNIQSTHSTVQCTLSIVWWSPSLENSTSPFWFEQTKLEVWIFSGLTIPFDYISAIIETILDASRWISSVRHPHWSILLHMAIFFYHLNPHFIQKVFPIIRLQRSTK